MYSFTDIVRWFLHGLLQRILVWIPLVNPLAENRYHPPSWWYDCYGWVDWYYHINEAGQPNEHWCELYISCAWVHIRDHILGKAGEALQGVKDFLLGRIGYVHWAYSSLGSWVDAVSNKVGWSLPSWASSVIGGLWRLWNSLPTGIRNAWTSWDQIWDNIKLAVIRWAQARYEDARRLSFNAWNWLVGIGQQIEQWWRFYSNWLGNLASRPYAVLTQTLGSAWYFLMDFWQNPSQKVISWLGPTWRQLFIFARDCLRFWYNLWGSSASLLVELLDDPLEFVWQRAEHFILRKLE